MKRQFFSFAVLALGLVACNQSDLQFETSEIPSADFSKEIVEAGSTKVPLSLAEKVALSTRPGTRAGTDIQDIRTVFTDDGEPAFHAVNFANSNGYVLISASQNYTPILAEVETGSFDLVTLPDNVRFYLEGYKHAVKACNEAPEDSVKNYRRQWKQYLEDETTAQTPVTLSSDPYLDAFIFDSQRTWNNKGYDWSSLAENSLNLDFFYDVVFDLTDSRPDIDLNSCFIVLKPIEESDTINEMLTTKWGREKPYNVKIQNKYVDFLTVAVAQVMKYHKKPSMINWAAMKDIYEGGEEAPEVASLIKTLDKTSRTLVDTVFDYVTTRQAVFALHEFGYYTASTKAHDINTVKANIINRRPVIGFGSDMYSDKRHGWVYDGLDFIEEYYYYFILIPEKDPSSSGYFKYKWNEIDMMDRGLIKYTAPRKLFHINWGLDGEHNGWYSDHDLKFVENGTTFHYNSIREDIVNIK